MSDNYAWVDTYKYELKMAQDSRSAGNEGRARVCARRAAGVMLGEYFRQENLPDPGPSAYDRLKYFVNILSVPEKIRETAQHFILKIDFDHNLPIQADLIAETEWLAYELLGYPSNKQE